VQKFVTRVAIKMHSFFWTPRRANGIHDPGEVRDLNSRPSFRNRPSVVSFRTNRPLHSPDSHISSHISCSSHLLLLTSLASHISCFSHLSLLTTIKATPTSPKKHPLFLTSHPSTPLITATPCTSLSSFVTLCGKGFGHHDTFDSIDQRVAANLRPQVE
jgi:hypothetical protein